MERIVFKTSQGDFIAEMIPDKNEQVAQEFSKHLPIRSTVKTWGEEIYFETPITAEVITPQEIVQLGDVGYWPPGKALCLFFGKTPISSDNEIKPASAVGVFAQIATPFEALKLVRDGEEIVVQKSD